MPGKQVRKVAKEERATEERRDVADDLDLLDHPETLLEEKEELDQLGLLALTERDQDPTLEPSDWMEREPSDQNLDPQDLLDPTDVKDHADPSETVGSQDHQV